VTTLAAVRRALRDHHPRPVDPPPSPEAQLAAVALILLDAAEGLEALFIRRAERPGDPWSGQVALPGGRHQPADGELRVTAIRETREETGVDLAPAEQLGVLDDLHPRTPTLPPLVVRPFVFGVSLRPVVLRSEEVQRAFWLPLARLSQPGVRRAVALVVGGAVRTFPAYSVDGELIWGLTERILTPFLGLVGPGL
jgi:8-oxo-dGTP pyrophosphatase MutT (NUDIX family)